MTRPVPALSSLGIAVLFAACAAAAVPASAAPAPSATAPKPIEIPFKLRNNHILLRGVVNASDSLWFILDTGAMGNVLNRSTADRLKLAVEEGGQAHGAGGQVPAGRVTGATIRLPGVDVPDERLMAIALDRLALKTGHPCDGIIGAPLFKRSVVEIDYARAVLVVHDAKSFEYAGKGAKLALTFDHELPYIQGKVALPEDSPRSGRFVLDTGSVLSLVLAHSFVTEQGAVARVKPVHQARLGGVGGESDSPMGRIEALTIGPFVLGGPLAVLRTNRPGPTEGSGAIGNIGGEILRRFKVTFDYGRSKAYFEPGPSFADNFDADMSGLVLSVRDDGSGAIDVVLVQDPSPASQQGVRVGDQLVSVDGKPVAPAELGDLRQGLKVPGRTVKLELRRGTEPVEVTLVTRRLL